MHVLPHSNILVGAWVNHLFIISAYSIYFTSHPVISCMNLLQDESSFELLGAFNSINVAMDRASCTLGLFNEKLEARLLLCIHYVPSILCDVCIGSQNFLSRSWELLIKEQTQTNRTVQTIVCGVFFVCNPLLYIIAS